MIQIFADFSRWITANAGLIALLGSCATAIWTAFQYAVSKRSDRKKFQFQTYHALIKDLVQGELDEETKKITTKLDRQIATAYELRHFPLYFSVTERICNDLAKQWGSQNGRIVHELKLTAQYVKTRLKWKKRFRIAIVAIGLFMATFLFYACYKVWPGIDVFFKITMPS